MARMSIKECKRKAINSRTENTKEYRESVKKSNENLHHYEQQQAVMYKKAAEYCAR